jgi:hypothetical protein
MIVFLKISKVICGSLITLSIIILVINFIGFFFNPYDVENYQRIERGEDTSISYETALNNIKYEKYRHEKRLKTKDQDDEELRLFEVIVNIVFKRMSNLFSEEESGKNLFIISIFDNWILWMKSNFIDPSYRHEFANPYRALKSGAGFCSQQSMAVVELLREFGYKAGAVGLKGHVVAWVKAKRGMYILDPDYGVIMPFDFTTACSNKDKIIEYYKNMKLKMLSEKRILDEAKMVADIYCANKGRYFEYKEGVDGYRGKGYTSQEDWLYTLKWVIPILFLCLSVIGYFSLKKFIPIKN